LSGSGFVVTFQAWWVFFLVLLLHLPVFFTGTGVMVIDTQSEKPQLQSQITVTAIVMNS